MVPIEHRLQGVRDRRLLQLRAYNMEKSKKLFCLKSQVETAKMGTPSCFMSIKTTGSEFDNFVAPNSSQQQYSQCSGATSSSPS